MIRYLLVSLVVCFAGVFAMSADKKDGKSHKQMFKEIQEFKMNFLAQEMDLSAEQKEKFFQLYDEMTHKRMACMRTARKLEKELKGKENPTEADYQAVTEAMAKAKAEDAKIEEAYFQKFPTFLSQKQIFKMKEAEDAFRQKIEMMRHNSKQKSKKK